jgi:hypothetical protein
MLNFIARFSLRKKRSKLKGTGTHFVACVNLADTIKRKTDKNVKDLYKER